MNREISKIIAKQGWTQTELAKASGIAVNTARKACHGEFDSMHMDSAIKILKVLGYKIKIVEL